MSSKKLFTIGYEGCEIDEFCQFLVSKKVRCVADVRKNPVSRKKGFSKRRLAEKLQEYQISYIHVAPLGVPTEWRKRAKEGLITRERMFKDYVKKVLPKETASLELLQELLKQKGLALLCYESDASDCHRSYVAQELYRAEKKKLKIENLVVQPPPSEIQLFR